MKAKCFLSIIVPVYNTPAEHLNRCLNSFNNQSCKEFELIVVDDGSNTETAEFIDEWAASREYVRVLHAGHGGASSARNKGLELVETEYVAFSDADDEYSCDFVKEAKEYVEKYRPDIIYGVIDFVPHKNSVQDDSKVHLYDKPEDIREVYKAFMHAPQNIIKFAIHNSQCSRVYLSQIAKMVKFNERVKWAEDQLFNRGCLRCAQSVCLVPNAWYTYYANEYSTTHKLADTYFNLKKSYYDAYCEMNRAEDEEMLRLLCVPKIADFNTLIVFDILGKSVSHSDNPNVGTSDRDKLVKALAHPYFKEAFEGLKGNRDIGLVNSIYVFLVNHRMYGTLLLLCRVGRTLRHVKRKILG